VGSVGPIRNLDPGRQKCPLLFSVMLNLGLDPNRDQLKKLRSFNNEFWFETLILYNPNRKNHQTRNFVISLAYE
jgi:hypothetical protein